MRNVVILLSAILLLFGPAVCIASHTFETEHADAPGRGNMIMVMEAEMAQDGGREKELGLPVLEFVYGLGKWTSFEIDWEYDFISHSDEVHSTSGSGDVELKFKHSPFHFDYGDIGAQVGVKLPTAKDDKDLGTGETDFELLLIHSYHGEKFATHLNAGVDFLGNPERRSSHEAVFTYSAVAVFPLHERVEWFAEIEGRTAKSVFGTESLLRSGFIFPIARGLEVGLGGGVGLTNDTEDWEAKLGIYWTWERGEEMEHH